MQVLFDPRKALFPKLQIHNDVSYRPYQVMCSCFCNEQHESFQAITFVVPVTRKEVGFVVDEGVVSGEAIYHSIIEHNKLIVRGREVLFFGGLALKESCNLIVN